MGTKLGKRTKKFTKKHLDGELRRRKVAKVKRNRALGDARKRRARGDDDGTHRCDAHARACAVLEARRRATRTRAAVEPRARGDGCGGWTRALARDVAVCAHGSIARDCALTMCVLRF